MTEQTKTMTVAELIAVLQTMPQDYPVFSAVVDLGCIRRYNIGKIENCIPMAFIGPRVELQSWACSIKEK